MSSLDLTVEVLDLSPKVTPADLYNFFSYCGTVDAIQLQRKEDQSQVALVAFRQPYAFQTALILDGSTIVDQPVRIVTACPQTIPIVWEKRNTMDLVPSSACLFQAVASRGLEIMNNTKDLLEEKGRAIAEQTRLTISAAEEAAGHVGSMGALWLSNAFSRVSKLGTSKRDNPNSRKQK
ncbi:RNA recognition motif domain [Dillenia turbinata]|uniref:RNA recognition motif domain n=1 Tax=Dillenia turbinata TaxID=194707 RepID=A0AAN8UHU4_9MAGN